MVRGVVLLLSTGGVESDRDRRGGGGAAMGGGGVGTDDQMLLLNGHSMPKKRQGMPSVLSKLRTASFALKRDVLICPATITGSDSDRVHDEGGGVAAPAAAAAGA